MKTLIPFHSISLLNKTKIEGVNKDGMVCTVLVGAALEAFLHDLQAWYKSVFESKLGINRNLRNGVIRVDNDYFEITSDEVELMNFLQKLEQDREPISSKYLKISAKLDVNPYQVGRAPFQDFSDLIKIRNLLVHLKTEPLRVDSDNKSILKESYPKVIRNLVQRKHIDDSLVNDSWINALNCEPFVHWLRKTYAEIVADILFSLPETDISQFFKEQYYFAIGADRY
ncbi:hypothetical protein I8D50_000448 [Vibrio vulnificus]|uniref:hypothetical protein n=1 Tax=Vibrio vulnificus TaxID=672 RepID=UPI00165D5C25|nr:hypothetical protein [Vibrio vulnificus]EGR0694112.1 hypothetical protein [Vibrio parahaemolyticus]EGR9006354.1 hypothetical protein [Vibrio vulnificus]EJG0889489.1 hypothetical protein [Vibrio parahaemolyticus]EKN4607226.1 hypothetical protein [Vibrio parahaemolyticus]ELR9975116.1 hypothetical protein [Vibrio parahaemolyticus]